MNTKQIDEFKLFVDDAQQNYTNPPITGVKINIIPVHTSELNIIQDTHIIRIDIPKINKNIVAMDGKKYIRYNASFRTDGNQTFVRICEYESLNSKNKSLQKDLDEAKKKIKILEKDDKNKIDIPKMNFEKSLILEKELNELKKKYSILETKVNNYEKVFGEYCLIKK